MIDDFEYSEKRFLVNQVPINFVPIHLSSKKGFCENCKIQFDLDWLEKRWLKTNIAIQDSHKYAQRMSFQFHCPECNAGFDWNINRTEPKATYHFYGDEAYRYSNDDEFIIVSYAFLGVNRANEKILENCLKTIKERLLPDVDSSKWILHIKDFYSSSDRRKSALFKNWDYMKATRAVEICQQEISALPEEIYKACSVGIAKNTNKVKKRVFEKFLRKEAFWHFYIHILDFSSRSTVIPKYFLESDGKDGWGVNEFIGLKYTPLFVELSKSNIIEPPYFKNKSHFGLTQLADIIAFVAAREALKIIDGKKSDISTCKFGKIKWYGFDGTGQPRIHDSIGYPWSEFHSLA